MKSVFLRGLQTILLVILLIHNMGSYSQPNNQFMQKWQRMNRSKQNALKEFQDLKFGMFIHWGLYSIPAGIWKGRKMEEMGNLGVAEWIQLVAKIPRNEYAKLADSFNPVSFDADSIARMAKHAGMQYLVITAKHHEGFAMYKSSASSFNIVDATPFKRDAVSELYKACKKYGLRFGLYYSHNIDWADGADAQYQETKEKNDREGKKTSSFGANLWDPSPNTFQSYLDKKSVPQVKELLTMFPDTRYLWFDMPELMKPDQSFRFYKTVYDMNPRIIVAERIGNKMGDYAIPGDNKIPKDAAHIGIPWETVGTFNNSWGYKSYDHDWKSVEELLYWLVQIVSKGGNYMLNIGPRADGSVPEETVQNLRRIGEWTSINAGAIYGTRPWRIAHEGPAEYEITDTEQREREGFKASISAADFWFTQKAGDVYVMALKVPADGKLLIKSLGSSAGTVKKVEMPGFGVLPFSQTRQGLQLQLPTQALALPYGYSLKVTLKQ